MWRPRGVGRSGSWDPNGVSRRSCAGRSAPGEVSLGNGVGEHPGGNLPGRPRWPCRRCGRERASFARGWTVSGVPRPSRPRPESVDGALRGFSPCRPPHWLSWPASSSARSFLSHPGHPDLATSWPGRAGQVPDAHLLGGGCRHRRSLFLQHQPQLKVAGLRA